MTWVIRITKRFTHLEDDIWGFTTMSRENGVTNEEILDLAREDVASILDDAEWEIFEEKEQGKAAVRRALEEKR